ncbi:LysR family transcriptional regulator [Pediococcus siamensis]|uniref:LysR family transcriptional regulator n=1 Tax=Pediococcus siamensis TaxID=381829 RepID=UPI0039A2C3C0
MEYRILRYFWTIAEEGTMAKAARLLHITQPTLSRQIHELEDELGTPLFNRTKGRLSLTEAGLFLKSRAEEILDLTEQTKQEFADRRSELFSGHIRIGCVEADNSDTLAMMLEEFVNDYPEITFTIFSGSSADVSDLLDKGLIDLGILLQPIDLHKYQQIVLPRTEKWGLLVSNESFLAQKKGITPQDLIGIPLLMPSQPEMQRMVTNWADVTLDELNIVGDFNLSFNAISLVTREIGSLVGIEGANSMVPASETTFVPLDPVVKTNCVLVWRKGRIMSPVVSEFVKKFHQAFA